MTYKTAQILGGLLAAGVVGGVLLVGRALPPPCHGALRIELRPPLKTASSPFRFELQTGGENSAEPKQRCDFEVALGAKAEVTRKDCAHPLQLQLRSSPGEVAITGVLLGAMPKRLSLKVHAGDELLYDSNLEPSYAANISAQRTVAGEERFCGAAALVKPDCVRGSSQCLPFKALCDGPEDCPKGQVCCAAPEWGMSYGAGNAMECSTRSRCTSRIESFVVCHVDEDCAQDTLCGAHTAGASFEPALSLCVPRPPSR